MKPMRQAEATSAAYRQYQHDTAVYGLQGAMRVHRILGQLLRAERARRSKIESRKG